MKFARYIGIAHDDVARFFPSEKTALVGIPLRKNIKEIHQDPFQSWESRMTNPLIYVTGGSLGADKLKQCYFGNLRRTVA